MTKPNNWNTRFFYVQFRILFFFCTPSTNYAAHARTLLLHACDTYAFLLFTKFAPSVIFICSTKEYQSFIRVGWSKGQKKTIKTNKHFFALSTIIFVYLSFSSFWWNDAGLFTLPIACSINQCHHKHYNIVHWRIDSSRFVNGSFRVLWHQSHWSIDHFLNDCVWHQSLAM